jgi:hypothetical protein
VAWKKVAYTADPVDHPDVKEFLAAVGANYVNGGAVLRSFRATDAAAFDFAVSNQTRGIDHAIQTFLTSPSVVAELPELQIEVPLRRPPGFRLRTPLGMEGDLASMLLRGGAYEDFQGSIEQARSLSRRFMEAIFGVDFPRQVWVAHSDQPWAKWFEDVAWDGTFVVQEYRHKRIVLLCVTDTD